MIERDYSKFIQMVDLSRADNVYEFGVDGEIKAYFYGLGFGVFVITSDDNRIGIMDIYGSDILIQIEPEYRDKHYMSTFLKSGIWRLYAKHIESITIDGTHITGVADYDKKIHLIRDIMKLRIRNIDCAVGCVLDIWNYDDKLTFEEEYELRDFAKNLNTYHYWDELIPMFKRAKR